MKQQQTIVFIDKNVFVSVQGIETIEYLNRDYLHRLYTYPILPARRLHRRLKINAIKLAIAQEDYL